jgi:hypothetical protein
MLTAQVNYVAVLVAATAAWLFGVVWYSVFSGRWAAALGRAKDQLLPGRWQSAGTLAVSFVAELLMAAVLARLIAAMGPVSVAAGLSTAIVCWLGLVLTTIVVNNGYTRNRSALSVVASWHWLGVMLIMGAVIGAFG